MVRVVVAVLSALSLTTATAHANAIAVGTPPDLVAGVEFQIAAVWSTPTAPSGFVGVTVKPSGPGCAPNFKADFKWETPGATGDDAIEGFTCPDAHPRASQSAVSAQWPRRLSRLGRASVYGGATRPPGVLRTWNITLRPPRGRKSTAPLGTRSRHATWGTRNASVYARPQLRRYAAPPASSISPPRSWYRSAWYSTWRSVGLNCPMSCATNSATSTTAVTIVTVGVSRGATAPIDHAAPTAPRTMSRAAGPMR